MQWFVLPVNPEPWALGPVGVARKGGHLRGYVGRNEQLANFKSAVQEALKHQLSPDYLLITGRVRLQFFFWRNIAAYTTPQARTARKHEADVTNLQKATEDALQGLLFKNDKDTNDVRSVLFDQGPDVTGMIVVAIEANSVYPESALKCIPDHVLDHMSDLATETIWSDLAENEHDTSPEALF